MVVQVGCEKLSKETIFKGNLYNHSGSVFSSDISSDLSKGRWRTICGGFMLSEFL